MTNDSPRRGAYLRLGTHAALKELERPFLYHILRDELYELDETAMEFLSRCDGSTREPGLHADEGFVSYCIDEGLLEALERPEHIPVPIGHSPIPSLRYLELQLLHECNLACRHCYLGSRRSGKMPLEAAVSIAREFEAMGGLRLLISGGEPLLYPDLLAFLEITADLKIRRVLLTNGMLITKEKASRIRCEEIQVSLDGWEKGHDMLRGAGAFRKAVEGILAAKEAGIQVSIATVIHRGNLGEFERMREFADEIGAVEWGVDVLCMAGELQHNLDLVVPFEEAAPYLDYSYGGGYHGPSNGYACGRHLMTVTPGGTAVKCGFYEDKPLGDARSGLRSCWLNLEQIPLEALECRGCPVIDECAGGCRFRADHPLGPDRAMCARYGITPGDRGETRD